jgi:hypothetical protein
MLKHRLQECHAFPAFCPPEVASGNVVSEGFPGEIAANSFGGIRIAFGD